MSKITREEVCEYCHTKLHYNTNDNKYYCINTICNEYLIPKELNQPPQLSDDVLFHKLHMFKYNMFIRDIQRQNSAEQIKQHIQAQSSEIDNKENYNNSLECLIKGQNETINLLTKDRDNALDQLNAIREVVGKKHIKFNDRGTPYTPKEYKQQAYDEVFNILLENK